MAQLDIPIAQKKCATCRWWSGARKLIFVGADPKFVRIGGVLPAVNCRAWDGRKFGGASTAGVRVEPVAFLVIKDGITRVLPVAMPAMSTADRVIDMVPEVMDRVENFIEKRKAEKEVF